MNKKSLPFLGLVLVLSGGPALRADPLVVLPSGGFACSVAVTSHKSDAAAAHSPSPLAPSHISAPPVAQPGPADAQPATEKSAVIQAVNILIAGKFQRNQMTWSNGQTTEAWISLDRGLTLAQQADNLNGYIYKLMPGSDFLNSLCPTILNLSASSMSWINPQSFTGKVDRQGKPTLHYQATRSFSIPWHPSRTLVFQAWINAKTLAPLAFDDGDALYDLTFSAPPPGPLVMPPRFQWELDHYEKANASFKHL